MFTIDITKRKEKILKPLAKMKNQLCALNSDIQDTIAEIHLTNEALSEQMEENNKKEIILKQNANDIVAQINRFNNLL